MDRVLIHYDDDDTERWVDKSYKLKFPHNPTQVEMRPAQGIYFCREACLVSV